MGSSPPLKSATRPSGASTALYYADGEDSLRHTRLVDDIVKA
jgi:hypothetical protein